MENLSAKGDGMWSTTESPLTAEEEDTIITLVVVIVGVVAAIILLFSMGIFIDCKTQKSNSGVVGSNPSKRRRLRLKMPPLGRAKQHQRLGRDDSKCLAADMCPTGSSEVAGGSSLEAVV